MSQDAQVYKDVLDDRERIDFLEMALLGCSFLHEGVDVQTAWSDSKVKSDFRKQKELPSTRRKRHLPL